ncbi:hypothetical protein ACFST9_03050 [Hymenobacter monticola]|uniref:STAS/SEC14 domain-containing protein n=1 Tax=Hymenobacter monticola TaxID=1705399 RepID=A0ABY4B406_9BACT|nr:hypothetical protein [Hymenobacter monticola]UOE33062.1 hypothetical protein MTP16_18275 [Hymenobacter monticola]
MRLYFENPVGRLLEHPDGYALVQYAPGVRDFPTYQAFLTHTSQLLRRHGWHKLLADQRQMAPFTDEERNWIREFWLARSEDEGYELFGAILIPADVFAQLSLNMVMNDSQQSALTYRMFANEAEAVEWLQQQG